MIVCLLLPAFLYNSVFIFVYFSWLFLITITSRSTTNSDLHKRLCRSLLFLGSVFVIVPCNSQFLSETFYKALSIHQFILFSFLWPQKLQRTNSNCRSSEKHVWLNITWISDWLMLLPSTINYLWFTKYNFY